MTSFRGTFGLTRSIGGWEEGEKRDRNKWKRQLGRTGAGQRRELQLNEQCEEINIDVEEREENIDVEEREKERERGSNLRRQRLASPIAQVLLGAERSPKARHEANSFEPAEWSEQLTPGQSSWLGAAAGGSIPALALSLFLQRLYFLLFLQRLYLSLHASCLFSCHSLLCPASVRPGCLFRLFLSLLSPLAASSTCFFPFFLPPPNPQSTVSVRT